MTFRKYSWTGRNTFIAALETAIELHPAWGWEELYLHAVAQWLGSGNLEQEVLDIKRQMFPQDYEAEAKEDAALLRQEVVGR